MLTLGLIKLFKGPVNKNPSFEIIKNVIIFFFFFALAIFFTKVQFCILKNQNLDFFSSDSCSQGPYTTLLDPGLVDL